MTTATAPSTTATVGTPPAAPATRRRQGRIAEVRSSMPRAAWAIICTALAVLVLYPLAVLVVTALTGPDGSLSLSNFAGLASPTAGISLLTGLGNSIFVSLTVTAVTVFVSTLAGYAFARLPFPGSNIVFFVVLVTFMIPFQAIITPLFLTLIQVGLHDSLFGLALVLATFNLPFGIFLMRNSFAAIPLTLEDAALLDGNTPLQAARRIMLPLAVPGLVSTALLTFFAAWNDFFATLILINDQSKYTLPVSLSILSAGQNNAVDWGLMQAGVAVTVVPCIVIYLLLQKYYVAGLISGAVK
ncbi:carbohydrate ABC transporter permease [Marisediminicola sp. LYQ134]|uniref:carbohydrate ABC transporter permease n=1 Tax=unclassified Marisediminicola TaxID=2618316 RepID=UPI0039832F1F